LDFARYKYVQHYLIFVIVHFGLQPVTEECSSDTVIICTLSACSKVAA